MTGYVNIDTTAPSTTATGLQVDGDSGLAQLEPSR